MISWMQSKTILYQSMSSCGGYLNSDCYRWVHISHGIRFLANWIASLLSIRLKHAYWITTGIIFPKANGYIYKYETCLLWVLCNIASGITISKFPSNKFLTAIFVMQTKRETSTSHMNCISKARSLQKFMLPSLLGFTCFRLLKNLTI